MEKPTKYICLIKGKSNETYTEFTSRIYTELLKLSKHQNIIRLSYTITTEAPPKISIIPFKKNKIASISLFINDNKTIENIVKIPGFEGMYQVNDAYPVAYEKTWNDGDATPGVCLLTLFQKKNSIDYKTFFDRWFNSHTPMSLKYHPLWHYNRNAVDKKLNESLFSWDGIVEEHFRTRSELFNPFKFFGNPLVIIPRMLNVYLDTNSFLDYRTIEPYLATEYHIKS